MKNFNRLVHFIEKYKILHIVFWIWLFFQTLHMRIELQGGDTKKNLSNTFNDVFAKMSCVYFIMYYLVPKYFNRYRYYSFLCASLLFLVINAVVFTMLHKLYLFIFFGRSINYGNVLLYTFTGFVDSLPISAGFTALGIISSRYKTDQRNKRLEKERVETELSFLKAQMNPHFLFNAMNSIYILIDINPKEARDAMLKFSGLLRYQLYECGDGKVYVSRELQFLDDYIGLEKLRSKNLKVDYRKPDQLPNFEIAPFLVIPLVENAFKHVSRHTDQENYISIEITAGDNEFYIAISNSYDPALQEKETVGGIGLHNVTRRLQLIYPGSHHLSVKKTANEYSVKLSVYGNKNELHHS